PTPLSTADADAAWNTEQNLAWYLIRNNLGVPAGNVYNQGTTPGFVAPSFSATGNTLELDVPSTTVNFRARKSNSTYEASVAFYDRFRRKCGIVKNYQIANIPVRTNTQVLFDSVTAWTLSNTNALVEIPDWAWYYQMHITKNLTTRFFLQTYSAKSSYVTKTGPVGAYVYTYNNTTWALNTNYAISFDLSQLLSNGLGYTFSPGDVLICYKADGTHFIQPILGVDGN